MEVQEFTLSLKPDDKSRPIPVVYANQYDVGRVYAATILDVDGNPYVFSDETVTIAGTKPSKTGFSYTASASGNVVTFATTGQMTVVHGNVRCGIIIEKDGVVIGTLVFILYVQKAALTTDTIIDSDDFGTLITDAVVEWMDEHGVPIDSTLTVQGSAADAKATGDALKNRLALNYGAAEPLTSGTDYDTLTTPGNYKCGSANSATQMFNCPSVSAHRLFVMQTTATARILQIVMDATVYSRVWIRFWTGSTWGNWHKIAWEDQIPAVDATLAIAGDAADAKAVGDALTTINTQLTTDEELINLAMGSISDVLQQIFTDDNTYTTPVNLNYGGVGLSGGGNYQNAGYCRSDFLPISGPVLIVCDGLSDYRITGWYYSGNSSSAGTRPITNMFYYPTSTPLILEPQSNDKYFRFGFKRVDGANLTTDTEDPTSDYSIIRAGVKVLTKLGDGEYITDNGLGNIGKFATMEMYDRWAVCGASRDAGYIYPSASGSGTTRRGLSWGKMAAKRAGNDCGCFAIAGATAASWINAASYGLNAMLADDARQLYVVSFGYNEVAGGTSIGTAANMHDDIASYTSADLATMYGALSYIILNIKQHAPNALIIGLFRYRDTMSAAYLESWNCVKGVASKYGYPVINWCDSPIHNAYLMDTDEYKYGAHPTATGYSMMASVWDDLYSRCVHDNWEYFSHFVG